jgi:hypothetical protein
MTSLSILSAVKMQSLLSFQPPDRDWPPPCHLHHFRAQFRSGLLCPFLGEFSFNSSPPSSLIKITIFKIFKLTSWFLYPSFCTLGNLFYPSYFS